MSTRQRDDALPGPGQPDDSMPRRDSDVWMKTYRYLRIAMALLLIALATAVFYQSARQGSLLASVSAYYYSPAQSIFVGGLIGLGACMIALKGTTPVEDTFLNLGGMFAAVVAIVERRTSAGRQDPPHPASDQRPQCSKEGPRFLHTWIAMALLVIGVISVVAWWRHWITLFWLEIIVFLLFIAFWVAQTVEQDGKPPATEPVPDEALRREAKR